MARIAAVPVASESPSASPRAVAHAHAHGAEGLFGAELADAHPKAMADKKSAAKPDPASGSVSTPASTPAQPTLKLVLSAHNEDVASKAVQPDSKASPPSSPGIAAVPADGKPHFAPHQQPGSAAKVDEKSLQAPAQANAAPVVNKSVPQQPMTAQVDAEDVDVAIPSQIPPTAANAKAAVVVRDSKAPSRAAPMVSAGTARAVSDLVSEDHVDAPAAESANQNPSAAQDASQQPADEVRQAPAQRIDANPLPAPAARPAMPPQLAAQAPETMQAAPLAQNPAPAALEKTDASQVPATSADATSIANLSAAIAVRAQTGARSFEIRLDPAELGRVEVQLDLDRGKAEATIVAHRPETLALLIQDSRNLERALTNAGLDASNLSLNFTLKGDGRQGDGGGASSRARTRSLPDAVVARSEATNASIAHLSSALSSNRLDIRV